MIITGGENVYTSEVELVLGDHPDVSECVVVGVPDETWGERVHAIVVLRDGASPRVEDIQIFCRGRARRVQGPEDLGVQEGTPETAHGQDRQRGTTRRVPGRHPLGVHGT